MRYYIIAGEASGDLHAANLVGQLRRLDPHAAFRGWGGDRMAARGVDLAMHYRDLAFMGFVEVAANLGTILRNLSFCRRDLARYAPDAVILVDYPGFNLRMARHARNMGLKVFYYISPQVWAWKSSRVKRIRETVDRMFVILPFEEAFYRRHGYSVTYVGHPLLEALADEEKTMPGREAFIARNALSGKPLVALLPGSRKQEIAAMLPVMLEAASRFPGYDFVIGGAPSVPESFYAPLLGASGARVLFGQGHSLLRASHAAVVTSGTATLETALLGVPEVVCYKGNYLSYLLARRLVRVPYISLVNLIMNETVVQELIQGGMTASRVAHELDRLLNDEPYRRQMLERMGKMRALLGDGQASARTAQAIFESLR